MATLDAGWSPASGKEEQPVIARPESNAEPVFPRADKPATEMPRQVLGGLSCPAAEDHSKEPERQQPGSAKGGSGGLLRGSIDEISK
jgi:hypothetical protein